MKPMMYLISAEGGEPIYPEYLFSTKRGAEREHFGVGPNERWEMKAVFRISGATLPLILKFPNGVFVDALQ